MKREFLIGTVFVSLLVCILVTGCFESETDNNPPVVENVGNAEGVVGEKMTVEINALDADDDELLYSIKEGPAGAHISQSGVLTWTPGEDDIGTHKFTIQVSDGKNFETVFFEVTIEENMVVNLRLNIQDGPDTVDEEAYFTTDDRILKVEQIGGDPIDWSELVIYCEVSGSGNRYELQVSTIVGDAYDQNTNSESQVGEVIIFNPTSDEDFRNGDYLDITITRGDAKVYTQKSIRVV